MLPDQFTTIDFFIFPVDFYWYDNYVNLITDVFKKKKKRYY